MNSAADWLQRDRFEKALPWARLYPLARSEAMVGPSFPLRQFGLVSWESWARGRFA